MRAQQCCLLACLIDCLIDCLFGEPNTHSDSLVYAFLSASRREMASLNRASLATWEHAMVQAQQKQLLSGVGCFELAERAVVEGIPN